LIVSLQLLQTTLENKEEKKMSHAFCPTMMYVVKTVKANVNVRRVCEDLFRRGKSRPLASLQQAPQHSMQRHNGSFVLATKPAGGVAPGPFAFFNFPFWGDRCAAKIAVLK
jgi:hypothetical protein